MYSLEQLALFDRCFFPEDALNWMLAAGATQHEAYEVMFWVKRNPKASVVGLYQEFISDPNFTAMIDSMVATFLQDKPT